MNQNQRAIASLKAGKITKYKGHGNSMNPRIPSGSVVTLEPVTDLSSLVAGDVVFCKVRCLHLVSALKGASSMWRNHEAVYKSTRLCLCGPEEAVAPRNSLN